MTETRQPIFKSLILVKDFITLVLVFPNCGLPFLGFQIMIWRVVFRFRQFRFNLKSWHLIKILNISSVISNTKKVEHILEMPGPGEFLIIVSRILHCIRMFTNNAANYFKDQRWSFSRLSTVKFCRTP